MMHFNSQAVDKVLLYSYSLCMNKKHIIKILIISIFFIFSFNSCNVEEEQKTLLERLNNLDGVTVSAIDTLPGFTQCFQIAITQPVDHNDPGGKFFQQRFYLSHRDENSPTVFYTTGYRVSRNSEKDLTSVIQGNQLLLVHRYFPNAIPSTDWTFLTTWQAASDQHRIKELFKSIYPGKWVSSGGSKGGMTALFYRYYFPDDMNSTVAYVAPIMEKVDDPRFEKFLQEVGTEECREKIKEFQRLILSKRDLIMPLFETYIQNNGLVFSIMSKEEAFEYAVLEFMFAFWQYGTESNCNSIPTIQTEMTDEELLNYLLQYSPVTYMTDTGFILYQPLFYQAYTELGYCTFVHTHLTDLLKYATSPSYRVFAPKNVVMTFQPAVMQNIITWLQHQGERIIYLYGGIDPWSAGALIPDPNLDSLMIMQPGANHIVRINNLDDKVLVIQALNRWLDLSINTMNLKTTPIDDEKDRF